MLKYVSTTCILRLRVWMTKEEKEYIFVENLRDAKD